MLKGFKEFLLRGNVIDLAIAVVIGTAFVAIVTAFSENIINPLIAAVGSVDSAGFGFQITDNPETFVNIGAVITAAINFALIAAVVYFALVVPVAAMNKKRKTAGEETLSDTDLLTEIRDLLAAGANTGRHNS